MDTTKILPQIDPERSACGIYALAACKVWDVVFPRDTTPYQIATAMMDPEITPEKLAEHRAWCAAREASLGQAIADLDAHADFGALAGARYAVKCLRAGLAETPNTGEARSAAQLAKRRVMAAANGDTPWEQWRCFKCGTVLCLIAPAPNMSIQLKCPRCGSFVEKHYTENTPLDDRLREQEASILRRVRSMLSE